MTTTHHCRECGEQVNEFCAEHPSAIVDSVQTAPKSYKPALLCSGVWSYNALRFATYAEAYAAAADTFSRWTVPTAYDAHPSDDAPNYYRWDNENVSGEITPERAKERARYVVDAFATLHHVARAIDDASKPPMFVVPWTRDVPVDSLPSHVQAAIKRCGYYVKTAPIIVAHDKITVSSICNDGQRVTVISVAKSEGPLDRRGTAPHNEFPWRYFEETGNWGGPNAFTTSSIDANPVRMIPAGGCIVRATSGSKRKSPSITVHVRAVDALTWLCPDAPSGIVARDAAAEGRHVAAWQIAYDGLPELPEPKDPLDPIERVVLQTFAGYKSRARKVEIMRCVAKDHPASTERECEAMIATATDNLVSQGLLKRARNGATSLTPHGRNNLRSRS